MYTSQHLYILSMLHNQAIVKPMVKSYTSALCTPLHAGHGLAIMFLHTTNPPKKNSCALPSTESRGWQARRPSLSTVARGWGAMRPSLSGVARGWRAMIPSLFPVARGWRAGRPSLCPGCRWRWCCCWSGLTCPTCCWSGCMSAAVTAAQSTGCSGWTGPWCKPSTPSRGGSGTRAASGSSPGGCTRGCWMDLPVSGLGKKNN